MKPLLTVFIDGLKPESVEHMPFLSTFSTKRKIVSELGYSSTCHASMYSGVHPNKHLDWFLLKYSPGTSPFMWIKRTGLYRSPDNIYTKYTCHKLTRFLYKDTSFFGLSLLLLWTPLKYWSYFDSTEKKFFTEKGFLGDYPTIFELLRIEGIPFDIAGVAYYPEESTKAIERYSFNKIKPWTYLFIGDVDPYSHKYGQDSVETIRKIREIDNVLEKSYRLFESSFDDFYFMCFSDHGHIDIKEEINLNSLFRSCGRLLKDYIHIIDANYARFWFKNERERNEVFRVLSEISDKGFILTEEHFKKYNINMPDNRYGDLIFYLNAPHIFYHEKIFAMGKQRSTTYRSMHGYIPDQPNYNGVFISNEKIQNHSCIELVDIMPSILHLFGIKIPKYVDGKVLWK